MIIEVGSIWESNNCGQFKVVAYKNALHVGIEFVETGYKSTVHACKVRSGSIKDKLFQSVLGVGFIGIGAHKVSANGKQTKPYKTWNSMLERCYSDTCQGKNPTYIG